MILCVVNVEKLNKFKRKRHIINAADITEMLKDPIFRAMVDFRKKVKAASKKYHEEK